MSICIFGDSITWGASDAEKGGWVERLKVYIGEKYEHIIYNLGMPGDNTEGLLQRIESETKLREPEIIIFAIGINDSQFVIPENKKQIPIEQFKDNLSKLHEAAKQFTENIIFIGLTRVDESKTRPIPWDADKEYDNSSIEEYDSAIKEFCADKQIKFVEISDLIKLEDLEDGLHPNANGHIKMFNRIKSEIEKELIGK